MVAFISLARTGCLLIVLAGSVAGFSQATVQHAQVELLSRQKSLRPASDVQLGVHFMLEKGWHIYWINPGDSGQPPSFKWHLPQGFTAGEIQWPRPERMKPSKALTDYGYHDDVLLPVTIHTPPSVSNSMPVEFGVEVKWLICREVCIPEHTELRLSLPVATSASADSQRAPLFARTMKLLPRPLPRMWKATVAAGKDQFLLTFRAGKAITEAQFFPLDPGQIDNAAPQKLHSTDTGATLTLKKSDQLLKPIAVLRGVLVVPGSPAYRIEAPVRPSIQ
ncbi:MAG: Protein-disulfide reductase [Candidatus Angelobacter sp.]|nr:Protein-disulfide reductase [Candidatus Angelobacter sp.]